MAPGMSEHNRPDGYRMDAFPSGERAVRCASCGVGEDPANALLVELRHPVFYSTSQTLRVEPCVVPVTGRHSSFSSCVTHVRGVGAREEVLFVVHAVPNITMVQDPVPLGNVAPGDHLPGVPVDADSLSPHPNLPVACLVERAGPQPARCSEYGVNRAVFVDPDPEVFDSVLAHGATRCTPERGIARATSRVRRFRVRGPSHAPRYSTTAGDVQ